MANIFKKIENTYDKTAKGLNQIWTIVFVLGIGIFLITVVNRSNNTSNNSSNTTSSNNTTSTEEIIIRGNSKSKIYHCPGQRDYENMADSDYLVNFNSEEEAISAGYRKASR